jgi:hypothetical protein
MKRSRALIPLLTFVLTAALAFPALAQAEGRRGVRRGHQHRGHHHVVHRVDREVVHGKVVVRGPRVVVSGPRVVVSTPRIIVRTPPIVRVPSHTVAVQRRYDDWQLIPSRTFAGAHEAVERAPFSDEKLAIIRDVARSWLLTTRQAMVLAEELPFSDDRVDALDAMYPSIVDPENFFEVYELLPFSDDRAELRRRIR